MKTSFNMLLLLALLALHALWGNPKPACATNNSTHPVSQQPGGAPTAINGLPVTRMRFSAPTWQDHKFRPQASGSEPYFCTSLTNVTLAPAVSPTMCGAAFCILFDSIPGRVSSASEALLLMICAHLTTHPPPAVGQGRTCLGLSLHDQRKDVPNCVTNTYGSCFVPDATMPR